MSGSAFAVCIKQSSLTCQFEHSVKVRSGLIGIFLFSLPSGSASFPLCCADEFTKNETACCPQGCGTCMLEYPLTPPVTSKI